MSGITHVSSLCFQSTIQINELNKCTYKTLSQIIFLPNTRGKINANLIQEMYLIQAMHMRLERESNPYQW